MTIFLDTPTPQPKDVDLLGLLMIPLFLALAMLWASRK